MSNTLKLEAHGDREIIMTRAFDAPRHLVFEAFTRPDLLRRWLLGPPGWTMPVCEVDLRVGGRYRYVWRNENGTEMTAGGILRIVFSWQFLLGAVFAFAARLLWRLKTTEPARATPAGGRAAVPAEPSAISGPIPAA